jgi:predicted transcriptional regulator
MHAVTTKPSSPTSPADAKDGPADDLAGGNIDKVRDILFGGQMRDYERRFARLEERLAQETAELKDDVRRRLAALEQFMKQEADSLADRIKTEHEERTDATKDLAREAHDTAKAFEKKTGQLDDQISRAQRDLRQQILELHQRMSDELKQKTDEVIARLNQEADQLRHDKTDRATLAALLTEMALRLTNELSIPGVDKGRHG